MLNYLPLEVQTKKVTDSRINRRKNKSGTVAWPRHSSTMPRRRGSPRCGFLRLGGSENLKNSASGSLRHRGLRLGVHSYT